MDQQYWKNFFDLSAIRFSDSPLKQVGKTIDGREIDEKQLALILHSISSLLNLDSTDCVIDLCCGNGILTNRISTIVDNICGVDFSEKLLDSARTFNKSKNISYLYYNIMELSKEFFSEYNKAYMCGALQYFVPADLEQLLGVVQKSPKLQKIFISSIPNRDNLRVYYDTNDKFEYYLRCEAEGHPHIGYWWTKEELASCAQKSGFEADFIMQNPDSFHYHYRFDCLLYR